MYFLILNGFAGHKNHRVLIQAFNKLEQLGENVELIVTLPSSAFAELSDGKALRNVVNLGVLGRDDVLARMRLCSALIFPSKAETFGIPLIEAVALGLPIIASELDFVRDVCLPVETFDPNSFDSIVDAVLRFAGRSHKARAKRFLSAEEFVSKLHRV